MGLAGEGGGEMKRFLKGICLLGVCLSAGCHTALYQPPACCQRLENRWGDCVDRIGRSTSVSNPRLNRRVNECMHECETPFFPW